MTLVSCSTKVLTVLLLHIRVRPEVRESREKLEILDQW